MIAIPIKSETKEDSSDDFSLDYGDTETVTDEVLERIQTTQLVSKKYVKEYDSLKSFKAKVSKFESGDECVDSCKVEVCEKTGGESTTNTFFDFTTCIFIH